jgi:hypothetical protein
MARGLICTRPPVSGGPPTTTGQQQQQSVIPLVAVDVHADIHDYATEVTVEQVPTDVDLSQ